jgi:hypothetical protein
MIDQDKSLRELIINDLLTNCNEYSVYEKADSILAIIAEPVKGALLSDVECKKAVSRWFYSDASTLSSSPDQAVAKSQIDAVLKLLEKRE